MAKKKPEPTVKPAYGTKPTQIRLTDDDKALFEEMRAENGLPSLASAIRWSGQFWLRNRPTRVAPKKPKKNPD